MKTAKDWFGNPATELRPWFIVLAVIHCITAFGIHWYAFPDEWFQTLELSSLLLFKKATYTQEIGLHLRNLTWPALLTIPLQLAEWVSPQSPALRFGLAHSFAGLLDLARVWGAWHVLTRALPRVLPKGAVAKDLRTFQNWRTLGMVLLFCLHFEWIGSVRLHFEHLSTVALWVSLGFLARGKFLAGGVAAVAIAAFRYPSGLLTAGICLAVLFRGHWKNTARLCTGALIGLILFGLADALVYGRPWESLWMYLQYNVFTGLSAQVFGEAGPFTYLEFFAHRWSRGYFLIPVGLALLAGFFRAAPKAARDREPWFYALVAFLAGHLLIAHKEQRFMIPTEGLFILGGVLGIAAGWKRVAAKVSRTAVMRTAWVFGIANLIASVSPVLIGDQFKYNGELFELGRWKDDPTICAAVSLRMLPSLAIPETPTGAILNATLPLKIHWYDQKPTCRPDQRIATLADQTSADVFEKDGCTPLSESRFSKKNRRWVSCPNTNKVFVVESPWVAVFGRIESLPSKQTTARDLVNIGFKTVPPPNCQHLCYRTEHP